jgi:hypothetical protein
MVWFAYWLKTGDGAAGAFLDSDSGGIRPADDRAGHGRGAESSSSVRRQSRRRSQHLPPMADIANAINLLFTNGQMLMANSIISAS